MNFPQAVSSCFKKYVTFSGRAPRSEYWYWALFVALLGGVAIIIDITVLHVDIHNPMAFYPMKTMLSLLTFLPGLSVLVRRLHDVGRSGWWWLIAFTIIGMIPLLIWLCRKGTSGANRFGLDPLA